MQAAKDHQERAFGIGPVGDHPDTPGAVGRVGQPEKLLRDLLQLGRERDPLAAPGPR